MRQARNYGALQETQRQADETQNTPAPEPAAEPQRPPPRTWTHYGDRVSQENSAYAWIRQNHGIRMAETNSAGRDGNASQQQPNQAEIQEARAAVEEARQREAAERAKLQQRERGMER